MLGMLGKAALTLSSWMSLSMPLGPNVLRTVSASAIHALILLTSCGVPWLVSVPSFSRMICGCCKEDRLFRSALQRVEAKRLSPTIPIIGIISISTAAGSLLLCDSSRMNQTVNGSTGTTGSNKNTFKNQRNGDQTCIKVHHISTGYVEHLVRAFCAFLNPGHGM